MKKIAFILLAALLVLPFQGCGEEEVVVIPVYEEFEGTLKSLGGIKVSESATHILQTEDGDILYVYSDAYDLDDDDYIGNEIEIYGEVTEASEKGKDVVNISRITVVEVEEDEVAEVVDNTYSDQELGFSWEIQSDWEVDRGSGFAAFLLPLIEDEDEDLELDEVEADNDYFAVKVLDNTDELELDEWLVEYDPAASEIAVASSIGEDFLNSLNITSELEDVEIYYIERTDGYVYEVSHYNFDIENRTYFRNLFYEALSTFKLIPFGEGYEIESKEQTAESSDVDSEEQGADSSEEEELEVSYDEAMGYIDDEFSGVTQYEFVDPYYVYVNYTDGEDEVRVLLQYGVGPGFDYDVLATFEPGDVTDWELVSGEDEAAGMPKALVQIAEGGETAVVEIMEGYRYFESGPYGFTIQYPSSWYYSGGGGHYSFSDTAEGDELIGLDILDYSVDSVSGTSVDLANGKIGKSVSGGIYVERDDSSCFYLEGGSDYESVILDMAGSIL